MAKTRKYDLLVLIDADLPEERRAQIIGDVKRQIESSEGGLKAESDWGTRKMAYEIKHRPEAHYHLFQFEATADLLGQLHHALRIEDAVLRHRVIEGAAPIGDRSVPRPSGRPQTPAGESGEAEVGTPEVGTPEAAPLEAAPSEVAPPEVATPEAATPEAATPEPSGPERATAEGGASDADTPADPASPRE